MIVGSRRWREIGFRIGTGHRLLGPPLPAAQRLLRDDAVAVPVVLRCRGGSQAMQGRRGAAAMLSDAPPPLTRSRRTGLDVSRSPAPRALLALLQHRR